MRWIDWVLVGVSAVFVVVGFALMFWMWDTPLGVDPIDAMPGEIIAVTAVKQLWVTFGGFLFVAGWVGLCLRLWAKR